MIKVIVFDFDGVLADSNRIKNDAWFDVFSDLSENEKQVAFEVFPKVKDRTRRVILEEVFRALGRPQEVVADLIQVKSAQYHVITQAGIIGSGLVSGAWEMLEEFSKKFSLYINSSTPQDALDETIDNLGIRQFFKRVYGRPETKESALEKILARESITGKETVFVGDAEFDRSAAEAFGCFFIGIRNDFNHWTEGENFVTVQSVRDVARIIDEVSG